MREYLDRFKEITKVDLTQFFEDYAYYVDNYYQDLINFYTSPSTTNVNKQTFIKLKELRGFSNRIDDVWGIYKNKFDNAVFHSIIDQYQDVKDKILTMSNLKKWLRSNKVYGSDTNVRRNVVLKQDQTLENVASELGYLEPNDNWSGLALDNHINEEDYSLIGGNVLSVSTQNTDFIQIQTVVEPISGINLYGKDIDKEFYFDSNDFAVLSYKDNINQVVDTYVNLRKGNVPEFPEDGIDKSILGGNKNSVQFPSIFRQLFELFQKDDRFASVQITDIDLVDDRISLYFTIVTRLKEILERNLPL